MKIKLFLLSFDVINLAWSNHDKSERISIYKPDEGDAFLLHTKHKGFGLWGLNLSPYDLPIPAAQDIHPA